MGVPVKDIKNKGGMVDLLAISTERKPPCGMQDESACKLSNSLGIEERMNWFVISVRRKGIML
jgi:hypothetical protein